MTPPRMGALSDARARTIALHRADLLQRAVEDLVRAGELGLPDDQARALATVRDRLAALSAAVDELADRAWWADLAGDGR